MRSKRNHLPTQTLPALQGAGKSTPRRAPARSGVGWPWPLPCKPQGPRKVTFAALQTRLVHSRGTRIAPTPAGGLRISACARTADLCVQLCVSGPELVWLDRVQHAVLNTAESARVSPVQQKSAWLAQLGQRTRVLNRLCLSRRLQLLALSSVQLSCSLTLLLLLCPGQLLSALLLVLIPSVYV